jgi:hypothetical protein
MFFSLPGIYFNAILICWFTVYYQKNGMVSSSIKPMKSIRPLLKAFAVGGLPGLVLSNILLFQLPKAGALIISTPALIGILISGILLHKDFLSNVGKKRTWNIRIALIIIVSTVLLFIFLMQG